MIEKSDKKNILVTVLSILIVALILITLTGIIYSKNKANDKMLKSTNIYNNIYIAGINVSDMTKDDALKTLDTINLTEKIILTYKDKQYIFNKSDFGVTLDKQSALDKAYNLGRTGSEKDRLKTIKDLKKYPQTINIEKNINEDIVKQKLEQISKEINIKPKNASLKKTDKGFEVIEGVDGLSIDFDKTYKSVIDALNLEGDQIVEIFVTVTKPKYLAEDLNKIQHKIGSFSTNYINRGGKDENRITNMKVASQRINGTILYPGEVFSTNQKFGATTKQNGYKPAPTIINGKFVDEYGGGVCQVSSTLYNAILYSELDIVERQNHSLKVGYCDYAYDATLAGDYIDFKFKNSTQYPIYIESYVSNEQVICNIYGYEERPQNRTIKFENALIDVIEPGPRVVKKTNELPKGEEKVIVKPLKGYKYKLYKLVYIDGKLTEKVLVNSSYYKPRAEEVLVGTK